MSCTVKSICLGHSCLNRYTYSVCFQCFLKKKQRHFSECNAGLIFIVSPKSWKLNFVVTKPNNKIAIETKNTHTKIPFWAETKPNEVKRNSCICNWRNLCNENPRLCNLSKNNRNPKPIEKLLTNWHCKRHQVSRTG